VRVARRALCDCFLFGRSPSQLVTAAAAALVDLEKKHDKNNKPNRILFLYARPS
jgi:hypothetical protein